MSKSVGIKEIAELAGVSIGTVDRVLHNRSGVSKKTALLILDVIKKTGYKKNNAASRLKLAQNNQIKIAVLLPIESLL
ncbi:MAG: LacI family DNA-binding transcriptional regulator, partial [Flavobacteriaceae bacterium]